MPTPEEIRVGIGISISELLAHLESLKAQHGWAEVPVSEVIRLIRQQVTAEKIELGILAVLPDLMELAKTGKSQVSKVPDRSAMA